MGIEGQSWIELRGDHSKLPADLAAMQRRVLAAASEVERKAKITMRLDKLKVESGLAELGAQFESIDRSAKIAVRLDKLKAETGLGELIAETKRLEEPVVIPVGYKFDDSGRLRDSKGRYVKAGGLGEGIDIPVRPHIDEGAGHREGGRFSARFLQGFSEKSQGITAVLGGLFRATAVVAALGSVGAAIGGFAVKSIAAFEQVQVAFEGLFQSKPLAKEFLGQLQDFAAKTPYEFDQLVGSAQRFLGAFGKNFRDQLIPTLTTIGDVAGALGAPPAAIDRITTALLQIKGKGKFAAEELMQIREALPGFDPVAAIAGQLGVSIPEAMKKLETGAISADDGIKLLLAGMKQFPGAAGAMDRQSATLNGRISTLKDTLQIAARQGFAPLAASVGSVVDSIAGALNSGRLQSVIDKIGGTAANLVDSLAPKLVPFIEDLAGGIGNILDALGPTLAQVFPVLSRAIGPLSEILAKLIAVAGSVVETFGNALLPVLELVAGAFSHFPVSVLTAVIDGFLALKVAASVSLAVEKLGVAFAGIAGPVGLAAGALTVFLLIMGQAGEADRRKTDTTRTFTQELQTNTQALLDNKEALDLIASGGSATANAIDLLNKSFTSGDNGEAILRNLGAIGLTGKDTVAVLLAYRGALNQVDDTNSQLGQTLAAQIGYWGQYGGSLRGVLITQGNLTLEGNKLAASLPAEAVAKVRAEFGKYADVILGVIATTDDNNAAAAQSKYAFLGLSQAIDGVKYDDLTDSQKALIDSLIGLRDATEDVDFDKTVRDTLNLAAAQDETTQAALAAAEAQTGVKRSTQDSGEAIKLYTQFLVEYANAIGKIKTAGRATDFTAIGTALSTIATPAQQARDALDGLSKRLSELSGLKVDLTEAHIQVQRLLDAIRGRDENGNPTGVSLDKDLGVTLDINTTAGQNNVETLLNGVKTLQTESNKIFETTGDSAGSAAIYAARIDQLKQAFIDAGGSAEDFDKLLRENALDPVTYKVAVDEASKGQLQKQVDTLSSTLDPKIIAEIQANIDSGNLATAQAQLQALKKVDPIVFNPELDENKAAAAKADLDLLTLVRNVALHPELADSEVAKVNKDFAALKPTVTPLVAVDGSAIQRAINSHPYIVNLQPLLTSRKLESGGYLQRFESGGLVQAFAGGGTPISMTPSHYSPDGTGPRFMYGEPSTHGEFFLSMAPSFHDRNVQLWTEAGRRLRVLGSGGPDKSASAYAAFTSTMLAKLDRLAVALAAAPPITVVAGTPQEAGSKVYWAHKQRVAVG